MGDNEQKALQLMADAEKKLTASKGFFGSLFGCVVKFYSFFLSFSWYYNILIHYDLLTPIYYNHGKFNIVKIIFCLKFFYRFQ